MFLVTNQPIDLFGNSASEYWAKLPPIPIHVVELSRDMPAAIHGTERIVKKSIEGIVNHALSYEANARSTSIERRISVIHAFFVSG